MFSQFLFSKAFKYLTLRTCSGIPACAYGPDMDAPSIKRQRGAEMVTDVTQWLQRGFGPYLYLTMRCSMCPAKQGLTVEQSARWYFCYRPNNGVFDTMGSSRPQAHDATPFPRCSPRCRQPCFPSGHRQSPGRQHACDGEEIAHAASTGMRKHISISW